MPDLRLGSRPLRPGPSNKDVLWNFIQRLKCPCMCNCNETIKKSRRRIFIAIKEYGESIPQDFHGQSTYRIVRIYMQSARFSWSIKRIGRIYDNLVRKNFMVNQSYLMYKSVQMVQRVIQVWNRKQLKATQTKLKGIHTRVQRLSGLQREQVTLYCTF